jgi:opacity protein-like surface antigen
MKNRFLIAFCGVFLLLAASPAFAVPKPFYVSVHAGGCFLENTDLTGNFNTVNLDFDPGPVVTGAFGYDFIGARLEGEIGYRQNGINGIKIRGQSFDPGGDFSVISFMANSIADFPNRTRFTPYVSLGAGLALVSLNEDKSLSLDFDTSDDEVFAYQGGVGVGYAVTNDLTLEIGYQYFATLDPQFKTTASQKVDFSYAVHNAMVGVRYGF